MSHGRVTVISHRLHVLLLPSSTGDLEVRSSIRNMVIDALAATGDLSQGPRTIKAGARTLYRRGESVHLTCFGSVPKTLPGRSIRVRGCPAGDVGEGVVEPP